MPILMSYGMIVMGLVSSLVLGGMGVSNITSEHWYSVNIHFPAKSGRPAEWHRDEFKGKNLKDAVERAKRNFSTADKVVPIEKGE